MCFHKQRHHPAKKIQEIKNLVYSEMLELKKENVSRCVHTFSRIGITLLCASIKNEHVLPPHRKENKKNKSDINLF